MTMYGDESPNPAAPLWSNQRLRIDLMKRRLSAGLQIVEAEHPRTDAEWRAGWLSGYIAADLLGVDVALAHERSGAPLDVERLAMALLAEGLVPMPTYRPDWSDSGMKAAIEAAETQARIMARAIVARLASPGEESAPVEGEKR